MVADDLSPERQVLLLRIARTSIDCHVRGERSSDSPPDDLVLRRNGAAFVTLYLGGELRGCIGCYEPVQPLYLAVSRCAVAAAAEDPRFAPLSLTELTELAISISVLSPLRRLAGPEEIELGRDGLLVEGWGRRGLLLPQVALHQGWDRESFLDEACRKAGLPPGVWRGNDVALFAFETFVFSERPRASSGDASG